MSGSFYRLSVSSSRRQLAFSMNLVLRISLGLLLISIIGAMVPWWFHPGGQPDGAITGTVVGILVALATFWRDSWIFQSTGNWLRRWGWGPFVFERCRSLKGFSGWSFEKLPRRPLEGGSGRAQLGFTTADGSWTIDRRFHEGWLESQRQALDLWTTWLNEDRNHET